MYAVQRRRPDLQVTRVAEVSHACVGVDVLVTATASTEPLVMKPWLAPGVHVNAVGADDPTKAELSAECLERADRIVVDSRVLTAVHGDLARAGNVRHDVVELGEVLSGSAVGRQGDDDITVCKLIGLGVQDLAAAEITLDLLHRGARVPGPAPASAIDIRQTGLAVQS